MSSKELGFPAKPIAFLARLKKNNSREWFDKHRDEYVTQLLEPSEAFVIEFGGRLEDITPDIRAIPKVDKSIFRLHRDVRFSKEKTPFKTNLGLFFWEGEGKKMENPGFYVHFEPGQFFIAGGLYMFTKEQMEVYRNAVADDASGRELAAIIKKLTAKGDIILGGKNYKKVPKGFPPEHPRAELLKHNGIYAWSKEADPKTLGDTDYVKHCFQLAKRLLPLHQWVVKYIG